MWMCGVTAPHFPSAREAGASVRRSRTLLLVMATVFSCALLSCSEHGGSPEAHSVQPRRALRLGLIPEHNIFRQLERFQPLADYLGRRIGATVELKILRRYGNIIDNFNSAKLDGAFFGSFTYVLAHSKLGVEVLARPRAADGSSSYCGLLIVRKDSGIRTVGDMKGKVFAFVDRATTAGYLFPLAYFRRNGLANYAQFFRETYFTGTHEDAISDVLSGKADAAGVKNTVFERIMTERPGARERLVVLEQSPWVPENGLALVRDTDPVLREAILTTLLHMHEEAEGVAALKELGAVSFIPTSNRDYWPVVSYAQQIGIDLARYDYRND